MITFSLRFLFCLFLLSSSIAMAANFSAPVINKNVTIFQNISASQCPTSWRGTLGPGSIVNATGYGVSTGMASVGVQSCSGCRFDSNSRSCVCSTCYGYYN